MKLTEKQKRFCDFVEQENKKHVDSSDQVEMIASVVLNLFHIYLTAKNETDKMTAARLINNLNKTIKSKINFWEMLGDSKEFERLVEKSKEPVRQTQKRRHQKKEDYSLTASEWKETLAFFNDRCAYCEKEGNLHYEHVHAFSKGGSFSKKNIIPACKSCNSSKGNKDYFEWFRSKPFFNARRLERIIWFTSE